MSKLVAAGVGEFGAASAVSSRLPLTSAMNSRVWREATPEGNKLNY
jgi:hypothetical protein